MDAAVELCLLPLGEETSFAEVADDGDDGALSTTTEVLLFLSLPLDFDGDDLDFLDGDDEETAGRGGGPVE